MKYPSEKVLGKIKIEKFWCLRKFILLEPLITSDRKVPENRCSAYLSLQE